MTLLARSKDRDAEFTEFASVASARLLRSALLLCGDWQLAEDLVQTTLAKLFVAWPRVQRADNADAYAHGTLTKAFLSHKRLRRNSESPAADPDQGHLGGALAPGADVNADLRVDLLAALRTLDPTDRAILVLRYWEDRSVSEVARQVGMSEAAVRARASRATARLRLTLGDRKEARS